METRYDGRVIDAFNELVTKSGLKTELKDLELRLAIRMVGLNAASTALTVAILGTLITLN